MTYHELMSTEKDYYEKLSANERELYLMNNEQLATLSIPNDLVQSFVDVSRLLNELHRVHVRYNELTDSLYTMPNATDEQQTQFDALSCINDELMSVTIAVGNYAAVLDLTVMDECDALYRYFAQVKMSKFDWLCDNYDINELL